MEHWLVHEQPFHLHTLTHLIQIQAIFRHLTNYIKVRRVEGEKEKGSWADLLTSSMGPLLVSRSETQVRALKTWGRFVR